MFERPTLGPGDPVSATILSEDMARYLVVLSICAGKRILDFGCGAGHGVRLIKGAGASFVLGVDPSPVLIEAARSNVVEEDVDFLVADPLEVSKIDEYGPFDVLIGRLDAEDDEQLRTALTKLKEIINAVNICVISFSIKHIYDTIDSNSPCDLRTHLKEYSRHAERILAPADQWLIGKRFVGVGIADAYDPNLPTQLQQNESRATTVRSASDFVVDVQVRDERACEKLIFYMGVWGGTIDPLRAHVSPRCDDGPQVYARADLAFERETRNQALISSLEKRCEKLRRTGALEKDAFVRQRAAFAREPTATETSQAATWFARRLQNLRSIRRRLPFP